MIRYNDKDGAPVGPVRDLQRALLADGRELPHFRDDGHLGPEAWAALEDAARARSIALPPRATGAEVPSALLAALRPLAVRPMDRRIPIDTARSWPSTGARAWLADRADGARLHAGVDLGTSHDYILAPEPCVVEQVITASYGGRLPRFSQPGGWGGYGPYAVLVRAASAGTPIDRWHLLSHIDRVVVREGDALLAGQRIAQVAPIGAHLHWEVRSQATPTGGAAVVEIVLDPGDWLYGIERRWTHGVDRCPTKPENTARTPRPCRPRARS